MEAQRLEKESTPKPNIQMLTDLNWVFWWTWVLGWTWAFEWSWITLDYVVYSANVVNFGDEWASPSTGVNSSTWAKYFSQFVELPTTGTTVDIKGRNKYWSGEQTFTIEREQTDQEIQAEKDAEQAKLQADQEAKQAQIQAQKDAEQAQIQADKEAKKAAKEAEQAQIAQEKYLNSPAYKNKLLQDKADEINDSSVEKWTLQRECKDWVRLMLKSPSSASFPWMADMTFRVEWGKIIAYGFVDSQNSFWAQLRTNLECIWELDWETMSLFDIKFFE